MERRKCSDVPISVRHQIILLGLPFLLNVASLFDRHFSFAPIAVNDKDPSHGRCPLYCWRFLSPVYLTWTSVARLFKFREIAPPLVTPVHARMPCLRWWCLHRFVRLAGLCQIAAEAINALVSHPGG